MKRMCCCHRSRSWRTASPQTGGPDLAGSLEASPDAVIGMLAGLVVHKDAVAQAATFKAMAGRVGGAAGAAGAADAAHVRALGVRREATSRLGALTMPALVLWGEDDALVLVAVGRQLAADLPTCRTPASTRSGVAAICRCWKSQRSRHRHSGSC